MKNIVELLTSLNLTMSSCESITGGWFSKIITDIPGASQVFKGSMIVYTNEAKINVAKIKKTTIDTFGAISSECAAEMATNTNEIFNTNVAISFTGNAGPIGLEDKPLGLVYIALQLPNGLIVKECYFQGNRNDIRNQALNYGCKLLQDNLLKLKKGITENKD